jgi:hypothetical protein
MKGIEMLLCDKNQKITHAQISRPNPPLKPPAKNDRPCDGSDAAARPARPTLSESFDQVFVLPSKMSTSLHIP